MWQFFHQSFWNLTAAICKEGIIYFDACYQVTLLFKLVERLVYPIFILTAVVGLVYWYWTTTPGYALTQIVFAVKNKDPDTFEKYVDIENIAYHAVDDVLHGPARESGIFGNFDSMIGIGIISLFKPEIAEIARSQVLNFIKAGALANSLPGGDKQAAALAAPPKEGAPPAPANPAPSDSAFNNDSPPPQSHDQISSMFGGKGKSGGSDGGGPVERFTKNLKLQQQLKDYGLCKKDKDGNGYAGVDYLKIDGPTALIGLKFHSTKLNRNFIIELKMEDSGGFWRITELSNLNDLVSTYLELREQMRSESGSLLLPGNDMRLLTCSSRSFPAH